MSRPLLMYFLLCLFMVEAGAVLAQPCTHTGWVASVLPGCGAVITDQSTGESLRAVEGADLLSGGQYIRYSTTPTALPPGCLQTSLPVVALTCLSDTLPCSAQFDHASGGDKMLTQYFEAFVTDEQQQQCMWFFGDGTTGTGRSTQHTYAQPGVYEVCLTVQDVWGCADKACRKVIVGMGQSLTCGYDLVATAVDKTLQGYLLPRNSPSGELLAAQWRLSKQSTVLAETPALLYNLPAYGTYIVTAEYAVRMPDGSFCTAADSKPLVVAPPTCDQPINTQAIPFCSPQESPVCGCDQVTYANECEAITSGVSAWWAGTCDQVPGTCHAQLSAQVLVGSPLSGFFVRFQNLSAGNYVFAQLDFGDGSPLWKGSKTDTIILHTYPTGGIYRANLTVWAPDGCESSVTQLVITDALQRTEGKLPPGTDYVYPGDANGDKQANVYDLLNIGVGHEADGAPRPFAHTNWAPQFAPNWASTVGGKVNLKHLDCDGNGTINDFDADVIQLHYSPIAPKKVIAEPQAPRLWLDLEGPDTIKVNPLQPGTLQLKGHVMLGSAVEPVLGLYGLAFTLQYPEFVNHNPETAFLASNSSLFGEKHHLVQSRDIHPRRQLDMGMVKTNHQAVSGYGRIAEVTFSWEYIIIIDVIGRTESNIVPFVVPVGGVRGIDPQGNPKEISSPAALDTIWIMMDPGISHTSSTDAADRVSLYPNPATNQVLVYTSDLPVERMEVCNAMGQVIHQQAVLAASKSLQRVDLEGWPSGCYTLRLLTAKGVVEKRLVVQQ